MAEYQAIFETEKHIISVCYEPLEDGLIFITQVDITEKPRSPFQERQAKGRPYPRQLHFFDDPATDLESTF